MTEITRELGTPSPGKPSRFRDYTCGVCREVFSTNCESIDIECANERCEARLCPCCGGWFGPAGIAKPQQPGNVPEGGAIALRPALSATVVMAARGQWLAIAFLGHVELTGYVTEVTIGGHGAFHVDLPEKLWGGNPLAWAEYAASALYSRRPLTEESVRAAWEAARKRRAESDRWLAEEDARLALEYGTGGQDRDETERHPF